MRLRDITICFICMFLAVALLIVAGSQLDYINSQRYEMKLISNVPLENAPPALAFATVAMGAFRGLVADILWIRADKLKEQGQFFDARQMAEWITTLQPRFAEVWEFQGWNMAYNISNCMPKSQPQERWRWVKNGYELLRDKGIPLNPKSLLLYRELARIFQHKIGFVADDSHKYYKYQLATAMEPLLGFADNKTFDALAEAPTSLSMILEDANVAAIVTAIKAADKTFDNDRDFVGNYLALRRTPSRFTPEAFEVIDHFRGTDALQKFDIFARAFQLRNVWKLDTVLMQQLNNTYGPTDFADPNKHLPLDWRHPDTHAIYWAVKGLQTADAKGDSATRANTDRIVIHSLQNLFRNGKIFIYNPPSKAQTQDHTGSTQDQPWKSIFLRPDLRMFDSYNKAVMAAIEQYREFEKPKPGTLFSFQTGHRNMLRNAILLFYQAGHIKPAHRIYKQLRELYPSDETKVPLLLFVRNKLRNELEGLELHNVREMIEMLLRESYFRYALRDDDEAFGREKMAKEIHTLYRKKHSDESRIDLPVFKLLRYTALLDFFNDPQYSMQLRQNLLGRIKIERPELAEQLMHQEQKLLKKTTPPAQ